MENRLGYLFTKEEQDQLKQLKIELKFINSLAMLKMEKNFIAHINKKYFRKPYDHFPIDFWITRIETELNELKRAYKLNDYVGMKEELADISNLCDYCFEAVLSR